MQLADFIRSHRDAIVAEWEQALRDMPRARELDRPELVDHVPKILDDFARSLSGAEPDATTVEHDAEVHAVERIGQGFSLSHVVREFGTLRTCILHLWSREHPALSVPEVIDLLRAFDAAVERAVERYTRMRSKLVEAFERVSTAAVESEDLDAFLRRLLDVFASTAPSVDGIAIFLRDGDRLRARAAIGLEDDVRSGLSVRIGDGIVGAVAASRQPILVHDAASDPRFASAVIRARGTKVFYAVPLVDREYVVGVAAVASTTLADLPEPEKRLFHAVAQRATSAILKQSFRYAAAHRAAELEAVIQSIPDAVFIGTAGRVVTANRAELELLGAERFDDIEHVSAQALFERLQVRDPATLEPIPYERHVYVRALRGERVTTEVVMRDPRTGNDVHARITAAPVVVSGRITGVVGVSTDITARKTLEKEREDFLNAIVHDLRNPLTAIRGSASLAARKLEERGDEDLAAVTHRIQRNAESLNRLLADLLDVTLAASGRLSVQPRTVRVDLIAREAGSEWAAASHVHVVETHASEPIEVKADPDRVRQVLGNLLSNAIKYSPRGGAVKVEVTREGPFARIAVTDEGIGVRDEDKARIFERYARAQSQSAVRGQGLGLFVAREIVRAHGGAMGVASEVGRGATFWFTLPIDEEEREQTVKLRRG